MSNNRWLKCYSFFVTECILSTQWMVVFVESVCLDSDNHSAHWESSYGQVTQQLMAPSRFSVVFRILNTIKCRYLKPSYGLIWSQLFSPWVKICRLTRSKCRWQCWIFLESVASFSRLERSLPKNRSAPFSSTFELVDCRVDREKFCWHLNTRRAQ